MIGMFNNSRRNMLGASLCVLLMFGSTPTFAKGYTREFIELLQSIVDDSTQPSRRRRLPSLEDIKVYYDGSIGSTKSNLSDASSSIDSKASGTNMSLSSTTYWDSDDSHTYVDLSQEPKFELDFKKEWTHKIWRNHVPHLIKFEHILDNPYPEKKNCVRCCAGLASKNCYKCSSSPGISKYYQCSRSDCSDNKKPCKTCRELGKTNDSFMVAGKHFSQELRTDSNGVDYVISHTRPKKYKRVDAGSPGRTAAVIIGAGYHILNGFRSKTDEEFEASKLYPTKDEHGNQNQRHRMEGNAPRGVVKAKDVIDPTVTIQNMIHDITKAAGVYIKEAKGDVRYASTTREFKVQQRKVIDWLKTFTKDPANTLITSVRQAKSLESQELVKPSWVPGIIAALNSTDREGPDVKFVIDFGSGKIALTDKNGNQENNEILTQDYFVDGKYVWGGIDAYIAELEKFMQAKSFDMSQVVARFTGKHRGGGIFSRNRRDTQGMIEALKNAGIQAEILTPEDEAKYGTESGLELAAPYFKDVYNFLVVELGRGSQQFGRYRQVLLPASQLASQED